MIISSKRKFSCPTGLSNVAKAVNSSSSAISSLSSPKSGSYSGGGDTSSSSSSPPTLNMVSRRNSRPAVFRYFALQNDDDYFDSFSSSPWSHHYSSDIKWNRHVVEGVSGVDTIHSVHTATID